MCLVVVLLAAVGGGEAILSGISCFWVSVVGFMNASVLINVLRPWRVVETFYVGVFEMGGCTDLKVFRMCHSHCGAR